MSKMSKMTLKFAEIGPDDLSRVGGKALNLGALARAGFRVPPGFCVTTQGFHAFVAGCPEMAALYEALDALDPSDVAAARSLGERVRGTLEAVPLPEKLVAELVAAWQELGPEHAYAVRSSATAEDLPGASFAGQQDTYLNVLGREAILSSVRRCMASLFTDRAILYRAKGRFGHRSVALSVVVQRMVRPEASGILFTADPISGHRGTLTIDAGFGLGEALVSGLVTADLYRVDKKTGTLREARIGDKALAIQALAGGGTEQVTLSESERKARVLSDADVAALTELGKRIEAHYGGVPQDIEWCLQAGQLYVVQARPITSLYPLIEPAPTGGAVHVYFSFSHAQNMTDPISPMGLDLLQTMLPFGRHHIDELPKERTVLVGAGNRLYVDVTPLLTSRPLRGAIHTVLNGVYPDIAAGIESLADREEVRRARGISRGALRTLGWLARTLVPRVAQRLLFARPEEFAPTANVMVEEVSAAFARQVASAPAGAARLRELEHQLTVLFMKVVQLPPAMGAGFLAMRQLRAEFRDTPHAADVELLQRGLVGNITTEMDLQVGDLADLVRPHPALAAALKRGLPDRAQIDALRKLPGGDAFVDALERFLDKFGMRCQGEIDVSRPRWREKPGLLFSSILGSLAQPEPGGHRAHFARLQAEALAAEQRLVDAASGPLAKRKVRRLSRVMRHGLGLREHAKYLLVRCLGIAHETLTAVAAELMKQGRLDAPDDIWFLRLCEVVSLLENRDTTDLRALIATRRQEFGRSSHLKPPLVVTSEGEAVLPARPKDLPPGAFAGLGASAGVVEGVARVILDPSTDVLHAGEILVAPYTDPGWTPLFVHAAGLVCDVGGMMTHGSVVAREYGIPAVVGTGDGTTRLRTGQRIRIDGARGIVQILDAEPSAN